MNLVERNCRVISNWPHLRCWSEKLILSANEALRTSGNLSSLLFSSFVDAKTQRLTHNETLRCCIWHARSFPAAPVWFFCCCARHTGPSRRPQGFCSTADSCSHSSLSARCFGEDSCLSVPDIKAVVMVLPPSEPKITITGSNRLVRPASDLRAPPGVAPFKELRITSTVMKGDGLGGREWRS